MNLFQKLIYVLLYCIIYTEVFPQGRSYISTDGNINNSFLTKSIFNISTFTPLKENNSAGVLDSLIFISSDSTRSRITYDYNDDLSLNNFTDAIWFNGKWNIGGKKKNTYNSNRNLESVLWENFNSKTGEWSKTAKDVYKYDSLGNMSFHLYQFFNEKEFLNGFKYEYYYDSANNLVSSVYQLWKDSIWVNNTKTINIFNSDNLKDSVLVQVWLNNLWINYLIGIYEYDERNNIVSIETKNWLENEWSSVSLGSFAYDENDNCIIEDWMEVNDIFWESSFRIFYEYDDKNNLVHLFGKKWENNEWIPADEPLKVTNPDGILYGYLAKEIFLYYRKPTSVESEKNIINRFNLLQNYPNPFNPNTVISYNIPEHALVTLNIYNLLGEKIKTLVNEEQTAGEYQIYFDGNNLPSGIYFYQFKTDRFQQTKKMLLLR